MRAWKARWKCGGNWGSAVRGSPGCVVGGGDGTCGLYGMQEERWLQHGLWSVPVRPAKQSQLAVYRGAPIMLTLNSWASKSLVLWASLGEAWHGGMQDPWVLAASPIDRYVVPFLPSIPSRAIEAQSRRLLEQQQQRR